MGTENNDKARPLYALYACECMHLSSDEIGIETDGSIIYQCSACGDTWNGGAE